MTFMFENDIDYLIDICNFEDLFDCKSGNHPILLQAYLGDRVTLESMVILNTLVNYVPDFDKKINEPIVWAEVKKKVVKYEPFLSVDKNKYKRILLEKLNGIL